MARFQEPPKILDLATEAQIRADHAGTLPPLHRITSSGKYIPEIDGLRFVAIVPVSRRSYWPNNGQRLHRHVGPQSARVPHRLRIELVDLLNVRLSLPDAHKIGQFVDFEVVRVGHNFNQTTP